MSVERVPELLAFYGVDTMLLIGGSLYRAGPALLDRSREFVDAVKRASWEGG
jgi:ribulose-bisphosphate carboxylase large chain